LVELRRLGCCDQQQLDNPLDRGVGRVDYGLDQPIG
jgi:hypothetical protein